MSCDPQQVTALVDDALEGDERTAVEAHVAGCGQCRAQAEEERHIRSSLRGLESPAPNFGLEQRVRRRLRSGGRMRTVARWLPPLAAVLVLGLFARSYAPFVAWELARDHRHCFSMERLPAAVMASEPDIVTSWFDDRGVRLPIVPSSVGSFALVGGRFCWLPDASKAAHLYYVSDDGQVSVFKLDHDVRMDDAFASWKKGRAVALVRLGSSVLGVVGDEEGQVDAFISRLRTSVARIGTDGPLVQPHPSF